MIEKEDWLDRHKKSNEQDWKDFVQYCRNCGFKFGMNKNGQEVIYAPACGLGRKVCKDGEQQSSTY